MSRPASTYRDARRGIARLMQHQAGGTVAEHTAPACRWNGREPCPQHAATQCARLCPQRDRYAAWSDTDEGRQAHAESFTLGGAPIG